MQRFPPCLLTPAECTKEQNDQIQESDAGASDGVSGQNQHWWRHLAGSRETIIVPDNPAN